MSIPIHSIALPEYALDPEPYFYAVGTKLDTFIKENFPNQWIAVRAISLQDHPNQTMDDLVNKIIKLGTDRYDPARKGVHHDIDEQFGIELHATPMIVRDSDLFCPHYSNRLETGSVFGDFLLDCYEGAKVDRGYPLRLDIMMVYDLTMLESAPMIWKGSDPVLCEDLINPEDTTVFKFKYPDEKPKALLGVIKII